MRLLSIVFGILVLAAMASGLTEAALVIGRPQAILVEPTPPVAPKPVTPAPVTPVPVVPAPAVVAAPTPPPPPVAATQPTATINGYVHMRADRSTASAIIADLYAGYSVNYPQVDAGLWQFVTYRGQNGYVYKTYLNY